MHGTFVCPAMSGCHLCIKRTDEVFKNHFRTDTGTGMESSSFEINKYKNKKKKKLIEIKMITERKDVNHGWLWSFRKTFSQSEEIELQNEWWDMVLVFHMLNQINCRRLAHARARTRTTGQFMYWMVNLVDSVCNTIRNWMSWLKFRFISAFFVLYREWRAGNQLELIRFFPFLSVCVCRRTLWPKVLFHRLMNFSAETKRKYVWYVYKWTSKVLKISGFFSEAFKK